MSEVCHDVSKEPSLQPECMESCFLSVIAIGYKGFKFLGVVSSNLLVLTPEYLTLTLFRTDQTLTVSIKVRSAEHTKSELMRLNVQVLALLCFPPLEHGCLP